MQESYAYVFLTILYGNAVPAPSLQTTTSQYFVRLDDYTYEPVSVIETGRPPLDGTLGS